MSKITKIDAVRAELSRIASRKDRADIFCPTMRACWSLPRVMVIGKMWTQSFEFDELVRILERTPSGAGEAFFWNFVSGHGADQIGAKKQRGVVVQLHEHRKLKKV